MKQKTREELIRENEAGHSELYKLRQMIDQVEHENRELEKKYNEIIERERNLLVNMLAQQFGRNFERRMPDGSYTNGVAIPDIDQNKKSPSYQDWRQHF